MLYHSIPSQLRISSSRGTELYVKSDDGLHKRGKQHTTAALLAKLWEKSLFHSRPQFQTFPYLKAICFHLITATFMSAPASTCHTQRDIHILQPKIFFKVCVVYTLNDSDNSPRHHSQPLNKKKGFGFFFTPVFEQTSQFTHAELQYHSSSELSKWVLLISAKINLRCVILGCRRKLWGQRGEHVNSKALGDGI